MGEAGWRCQASHRGPVSLGTSHQPGGRPESPVRTRHSTTHEIPGVSGTAVRNRGGGGAETDKRFPFSHTSPRCLLQDREGGPCPPPTLLLFPLLGSVLSVPFGSDNKVLTVWSAAPGTTQLPLEKLQSSNSSRDEAKILFACLAASTPVPRVQRGPRCACRGCSGTEGTAPNRCPDHSVSILVSAAAATHPRYESKKKHNQNCFT